MNLPRVGTFWLCCRGDSNFTYPYLQVPGLSTILPIENSRMARSCKGPATPISNPMCDVSISRKLPPGRQRPLNWRSRRDSFASDVEEGNSLRDSQRAASQGGVCPSLRGHERHSPSVGAVLEPAETNCREPRALPEALTLACWAAPEAGSFVPEGVVWRTALQPRSTKRPRGDCSDT